ncbi:MAG: family transporter [Verrucomicrobiaceae bacterium]|nr:family transporter [Verrucomicrobiaceae bacterium]
MAVTAFSKPNQTRFFAFLGAMLIFFLILHLQLIVVLYAGMLTYALVMKLSAHFIDRGARSRHSRWLAIVLVAVIVGATLVLSGFGLHLFLRNGLDVHDLLLQMGDILASARSWLPSSLGINLPQQDDLLASAGALLRTHAAEIGTFGLGALKNIGYALIGILLGSMVAIGTTAHTLHLGPISRHLVEQLAAVEDAFWRVISAQVRISALNTGLTAVYLLVVLPTFGVHLPLTKTLIAVTFLAGLLPVIGNLVSNTAITVISLSQSLGVAMASLGFLIVIHKLEYFVNARFVGAQINARPHEILVVMLLMERLLGPAGVVAAPVFYAWLKSEWHRWDRVQPPL